MAKSRKDTIISARTRHSHLTREMKREFYHRERREIRRRIEKLKDEIQSERVTTNLNDLGSLDALP
jgi:hypothetical protein